MLKEGMKYREEVEVNQEMTAEKLGNKGVPVFSTPEMLAFLERTCRHCVEPELEQGLGTVGISVELNHLASTPIGMQVRCECELTEIHNKRLVFQVKLFDEKELVGKAKHERYIVSPDALKAKIADKIRRHQKEENESEKNGNSGACC